MTWQQELKKWPRWLKVPIALVYYWGIQFKAWWNRVKFEAEMGRNGLGGNLNNDKGEG